MWNNLGFSFVFEQKYSVDCPFSYTELAAGWGKNHCAESTPLLFLPLLQKGGFQHTCWEIEVYCGVLEYLFKTWRVSAHPDCHSSCDSLSPDRLEMRTGHAVRMNTFLGKSMLFTCVSPQMKVYFGQWWLQATTAHLGAQLRTPDEKRYCATQLILAFHGGISKVLNVLCLGISFFLNVIYQISTISEHVRTVHYGLRF